MQKQQQTEIFFVDSKRCFCNGFGIVARRFLVKPVLVDDTCNVFLLSLVHEEECRKLRRIEFVKASDESRNEAKSEAGGRDLTLQGLPKPWRARL